MSTAVLVPPCPFCGTRLALRDLGCFPLHWCPGATGELRKREVDDRRRCREAERAGKRAKR